MCYILAKYRRRYNFGKKIFHFIPYIIHFFVEKNFPIFLFCVFFLAKPHYYYYCSTHCSSSSLNVIYIWYLARFMLEGVFIFCVTHFSLFRSYFLKVLDLGHIVINVLNKYISIMLKTETTK